jgi:hypothetical protein
MDVNSKEAKNWTRAMKAESRVEYLQSILLEVKDYLYNPFEPDNQSNTYKKVCAALEESDAQQKS